VPNVPLVDRAEVVHRVPAVGRCQAWSSVALALLMVLAGAVAAGLTPLVRPVEAGRRSGRTIFLPRLPPDAVTACRRGDAVQVARHAGADHVLLARHQRLRIKRFRRWCGLLPSSTALRNELRVAGIAGTLQVSHLDLPLPSRNHARAPPASNHSA
jgi:hypothetical protein